MVAPGLFFMDWMILVSIFVDCCMKMSRGDFGSWGEV
jgi:hypothetical protein